MKQITTWTTITTALATDCFKNKYDNKNKKNKKILIICDVRWCSFIKTSLFQCKSRSVYAYALCEGVYMSVCVLVFMINCI